MEAVLNLMGLKADAVGENDNLAALGIDSMQLMEVRAVMQKKLCRPIPLEMIGSLTVATLRELAAEAGSKGGRSSAAPAEVSPPLTCIYYSLPALYSNRQEAHSFFLTNADLECIAFARRRADRGICRLVDSVLTKRV